MKYALPCSCGNSIPVELGQAGQTVLCSCGQRLSIPSMRAIQQLPAVRESAGADRVSRRKWSLLRSTAFSLGLALAVGGFLWAGYIQLWRSHLDTEEVAWDGRLDADIELLQGMNLEEAWDAWLIVRDSGIGPYQPPDYIRARYVSEYWWENLMLPGIAVGAVGLLLLGLAIFWPRPRAVAAGRPPALE